LEGRYAGSNTVHPSVAAGVSLLAGGLSAQRAGGALLVQYQFGTTGQETTTETSPVFNPTIVASGVSATAVTDPNNTVGLESSSAATTPANAPFLRLDPQNSATAPNTATTPAESLANNKYFQFTITAAPGSDVDLTSLTFDVARGGGGTPRGFFVRTSADNFASGLTVTGNPALTANSFGNDVNTARPAYTAVTADLTGAQFQNIQSAVNGLTFRVYAYSPAAGSSLDFDNITINGTATVPEPASAGVLGLAAMGLLARRRRR